jgi:hypothetical protein
MRELNEKETEEVLKCVDSIMRDMIEKKIKSLTELTSVLEERIKDADCRDWLLSTLIADRTLKAIQELEEIKDKEKVNQVMFG